MNDPDLQLARRAISKVRGHGRIPAIEVYSGFHDDLFAEDILLVRAVLALQRLDASRPRRPQQGSEDLLRGFYGSTTS